MINDSNKSTVNSKPSSYKESTSNKSEPNKTELPIGISSGLCIGVALGIVFNNIGVFTAVGVCIGAFVGHLIKGHL